MFSLHQIHTVKTNIKNIKSAYMHTGEKLVVAVEGSATQFQLFFTKSCGRASLAQKYISTFVEN